MMFGEVEDVVEVPTFNGKRKDWIRCGMEYITKPHTKRDGWTTTAVTGGG